MYKEILEQLNKQFTEVKLILLYDAVFDNYSRKYNQELLEELLNKILFYEALARQSV